MATKKKTTKPKPLSLSELNKRIIVIENKLLEWEKWGKEWAEWYKEHGNVATADSGGNPTPPPPPPPGGGG